MNLGDVLLPEFIRHPKEAWADTKDSFHGDNNKDPVAHTVGNLDPVTAAIHNLQSHTGLTHGMSAEDNANYVLDKGFQNLADHTGVHRDTENGGADDWIGNKSATTIAALITAGAFASGAMNGGEPATPTTPSTPTTTSTPSTPENPGTMDWQQYTKYASMGQQQGQQRDEEEDRQQQPQQAQQMQPVATGDYDLGSRTPAVRTNLASTLPARINPAQVEWDT